MRCLKLTKNYLIRPKQFTTKDEEEIIFAPLFEDMKEKITIEKLEEIYPIFDVAEKKKEKAIQEHIAKNFSLNNFKIIPPNEFKNINSNVVVKFRGIMNREYSVNFVGKMTNYFNEVYLVNFIIDNPIDDIFYLICKNKTASEPLTVNIYENDYNTNINENRRDIFSFMYSCYYYWNYLIYIMIQETKTIIRNRVLQNHFKTLKDVISINRFGD